MTTTPTSYGLVNGKPYYLDTPARPSRIGRIIDTAAKVAIGAALSAIVTIAALSTPHTTTVPHVVFTPQRTASTASSTVSTFNDGYATAKQDDCRQGDQSACAWLRTN
jgi:hypothetical protein